MTALYIGASWDVRFLKILDNSNNFIHIDPSPNSNGTGYGDKIFIDTLLNKLNKVNYIITEESYNKLKDINENPTCLEFKNENKTLKYYINTWFPQDIDKIQNLRKDIENIDTLIVAGFNPSDEIINLIKKPIDLVFDTNTYYGSQVKENSLIEYLNSNIYSKHIKSMTLYKKIYRRFTFNNIKEVYQETK